WQLLPDRRRRLAVGPRRVGTEDQHAHLAGPLLRDRDQPRERRLALRIDRRADADHLRREGLRAAPGRDAPPVARAKVDVGDRRFGAPVVRRDEEGGEEREEEGGGEARHTLTARRRGPPRR